LISDDRRGHNWTNAIMGLKAKEIHLCGEDKSLKLVASIIEELGDELYVHQYGRLSPIKVET
jgi:ATP-dependent RNA helicase SUPV3L1/SUV3